MTAAPNSKKEEEESEEDEGGTYHEFKNLYDPITHQNGTKYETNNEQLSFTYNGKIDEYLVNSFNNLLANK